MLVVIGDSLRVQFDVLWRSAGAAGPMVVGAVTISDTLPDIDPSLTPTPVLVGQDYGRRSAKKSRRSEISRSGACSEGKWPPSGNCDHRVIVFDSSARPRTARSPRKFATAVGTGERCGRWPHTSAPPSRYRRP